MITRHVTNRADRTCHTGTFTQGGKRYMSADTDITPSNWAGGLHVCIPGLGVGRIISEGPRVIEIPLPAPECAVLLVDGRRAVVLRDPRVSSERALRAVAAARHLEESAAVDALTDLPVAVGEGTPPGGLPVVATYPRLRAVRPMVTPRG
jgi:hypothetical protein